MEGIHLPLLDVLLLLLILVPVAWLAVVALIVAICRMAAKGDGRRACAVEDAPIAARNGLVIWELPATGAVPDRLPVEPRPQGSRAARRRRLIAGHGARR